jgi:hypothetical protein
MVGRHGRVASWSWSKQQPVHWIETTVHRGRERRRWEEEQQRSEK